MMNFNKSRKRITNMTNENGASILISAGCCILFLFFVLSNAHSCVVCYLGSVPMATIAVKGAMSNVSPADDDCAETSLSVAGSVDNNNACLFAAASLSPLKRIFDF